MSVYDEAVEAIANNYADVIEGGNTYRGSGDAYKGIAGALSSDEDRGTVAITTDGSSDTDTIGWTGASAWASDRFVRDDGPPFFARCTSSADASSADNVGAARKITAWGTSSLTVAPAFPKDIFDAGDTFVLDEGFRRIPDNIDLFSELGPEGGFDRGFQISLLPGSRNFWYGDGVEHYTTVLELRLRILKRSRDRNARDSALRNVLLMRSILTRPSHRGDYVQILDASDSDPEFEVSDVEKFVVVDRYQLQYRINATYL